MKSDGWLCALSCKLLPRGLRIMIVSNPASSSALGGQAKFDDWKAICELLWSDYYHIITFSPQIYVNGGYLLNRILSISNQTSLISKVLQVPIMFSRSMPRWIKLKFIARKTIKFCGLHIIIHNNEHFSNFIFILHF